MRSISLIVLAPALMLAGCGASDEAARNTFRQASIEGCLSASRGQAPAGMANFDWNRLCTCATERVMEGKSASELAQLRPDGPGQREIVAQCLAEMQPGAAAAPGAPAPAAPAPAN